MRKYCKICKGTLSGEFYKKLGICGRHLDNPEIKKHFQEHLDNINTKTSKDTKQQKSLPQAINKAKKEVNKTHRMVSVYKFDDHYQIYNDREADILQDSIKLVNVLYWSNGKVIIA